MTAALAVRALGSVLVLALADALLPAPARAGEAPRSPDAHAAACLQDGVALGGRDPVSFWRGAIPEEGTPSLSFDYGGARYLFASERNRDEFAADPKRFLPRYSGWCAMTLAMGRLSCPDVTNFRIQDGKLLLFETTILTNGRVIWEQAPADNLERADRNFARRSDLRTPD